MKYQNYTEDRILFTVDNCPYCRLYEFIERTNSKLPIDKRIIVVNCTAFYDYGIVNDTRIRKYKKYLTGSFPVLFFDGKVLQGAKTRIELEATINALLDEEFIIEEDNDFIFKKDCEILRNKIFGDRLVCN